jgi:outer membrane receptor protein involved in Fe transport
VTDNFELIGGLRYSHDKKTADAVTAVDPTSSPLFKVLFQSNELKNQEYSEDKVTYTLTAQYNFTDDLMTYLTYSTGTKSGGFNAAPLAPGVPAEFDAETSDSIELGLKSTLLDGRMTLNVDVYRLNLKDFQDAVVNPNGSGFIVGNAGDRRAQGLELDARYVPFDDFTLGMSLAYLDAEYTKYPDGQCYFGQVPDGSKPNTCDYKGKTPYHSPEWMGSLTADYRHSLGSVVGFVGGDYAYTSEENTLATLDPRANQDSIGLLGARFGVESEDGTWRVTAYGKNLTDESYYTATNGLVFAQGIGAAAPGATPPALYAQANGLVGWYAPPRTYGVEVTYNF